MKKLINWLRIVRSVENVHKRKTIKNNLCEVMKNY